MFECCSLVTKGLYSSLSTVNAMKEVNGKMANFKKVGTIHLDHNGNIKVYWKYTIGSKFLPNANSHKLQAEILKKKLYKYVIEGGEL